jgi:hypothetical protein
MADKKRDYKKEAKYHATPEQKKRRASRNAARREMMAEGKVRRYDGKDVAHNDDNPLNNSKSNLRVQSKSQNRSFPRNSNGGKKR